MFLSGLSVKSRRTLRLADLNTRGSCSEFAEHKFAKEQRIFQTDRLCRVWQKVDEKLLLTTIR